MLKTEVLKTASLAGHRDCIYSLEKGKNDQVFFSSSGDGMVVEWDLNNPDNGTLLAKVANSVYAVHLLKEDNCLAIGQNFEGIHLISLDSKKEIASAKITTSYIFDIKSQGDFLYVATGDGYLIILDKKELTLVHKVKLSEKSLRAIAIDTSRQLAAFACSDNNFRIYSLEKNEIIYTVPAHENSIFTAVFSPDSKYLLTGGRDARLKVWDCEQGFILHEEIVAHTFALNHIQYAPDGKFFATCSMDKSIKIWDSNQFRLLKVIDKARHAGHATSVNRLLWLPWNDSLVSAGDDRMVSVWNLSFQIV
ncbi:MAG TPA: WD40 repeat domain-containing protein [Cytophagaceae bacterium]|jgi:WD40 repeat protein